MFTIIALLKRRSDLTMEQFVQLYENGHAKLGERVLGGAAIRYVRQYLRPLPNPMTGEAIESEHDVVVETSFADRATWEATMARLSAPDIAAEIIADEETLFDRTRNRFFLVEEHASAMA